MVFIDTNCFLRYFLQDNHNQYLEIKELLIKGAEGKIELATSIVVIFEIYWVLKSYYGHDKHAISSVLKTLLGLVFINLEGRTILIQAVEMFDQTNLGLPDCYNLVYAKTNKMKQFKTFDAKLAREFMR